MSAPVLSATYGMNVKPQIFIDITIPSKQLYGPNIGKQICAHLD
jgi:hypothetical protein